MLMNKQQFEECFKALLKNGELPTWRALGRLMGLNPKTVKSRYSGKFEIKFLWEGEKNE